MYRDVAKRVLAVILTFCMIGGMPDFTLLAGVESGNGRVDTSLEEGLAVDDGSSEAYELAGTETEASLEAGEKGASTQELEELEDTGQTADMEQADEGKMEEPADAEKVADAGIATADDVEQISLQDTRIKKPSELPNQIRGGIVPDGDGFVQNPILGLEIKDGDVSLAQITDKASTADGYKVYAVLGNNNTSAEITVTGNGKYKDDLKYSVVFGNDITGCTVTLSYGEYPTASYYYEGQPIEPAVAVAAADGTVLTAGTDYSVTYEDNEKAGTAHVKVRGVNNYAGECSVDFIIMQADASVIFEEVTVSDAVYNKSKSKLPDGIVPSEVTIINKYTGEPASPDDYSLRYRNNTYVSMPGQPAKVVISGKGNCMGSFEKNYQITRASFNDSAYPQEDKLMVELDPSYSLSYTGQPLMPPFTVYQGSKDGGTLEAGTDYNAVYSNNINVGTAKITITGLGNYTGSRDVNFTIGKFNVKDIDSSKIHVEKDGYEYTGEEIQPEVPDSLTDTAGHPLRRGTDYEVYYANNIDVGSGIIRIVGTGNNCTGELDVYFTIYKDIGNEDVIIEPIADQQYFGKAIHPLPVIKDKGTVLQKDRHYTLAYNVADPTDVGSYTITVTGDGKYYRGTRETQFRIVGRSMDSVEVQFTRPVANNTYTFTGSAIEPEVKVVDKESGSELPIADFDIAYAGANGEASPTVAGNCTVTATQKDVNKYLGNPVSASYTIAPKPLVEGRGFSIKLDGQDMINPAYTGEDIEPVVTVFDNLRDSATGSQVASGGAFQIPASDFSVQYANNRDAGIATVTVTGLNNYSGSISKNFRITPLELSSASSIGITLQPDREYVYTGDAVAPVVAEFTVDGKVLRADEYTVTSQAVNAGETEHTFTVAGTGNYRGSVASDAPVVEGGPVTFRILPKDIADLEVQLEDIPNQSYTGREIRPVPVMTYNGKALGAADYDLSYVNNVAQDYNTEDPALMPTVTITGKGNFTGTRSANFHICETIAGAVVTGLDNLVYTFNTAEWRPEPQSVVLNGRPLQKDVDYELFYKNNINAGNSSSPEAPTVVINGKGLYGGSIEKKFTIERVIMTLDGNGKLKPPLSSIIGMSPMFTGSGVWPTVTLKHSVRLETGASFTYVLEEGKDYEFSSNKHVNVGSNYSIELLPKGNYKLGTGTALRLGQYTIKAKPITAEEITIEVGEVDATRLPAEPPVRVVDARRDIDGNYVAENGTFELVRNRDYTLTYKKNTAPGTASITITGKGNYTGSATKTFLIPGNLSNAQVEFLDSSNSSDAYVYTGSDITPKLRVTCGTDATTGRVIELKNGTDFEYRINGDHTNCGTPEIELVGKGAYEGSTRRLTFRITPRSLTDSAVKINVPGSVDYNDGKNVEPKPSITLGKYTLIEGVDFICIYDDPCSMPSHISGKKYKVVIRAVNGGNFTGETFKEYTIGNNFNVKIEFADGSNGSYTYTGNEIIPALKVTDSVNGKELVKGKDYDMSYAPGNINVGKVTVTVFGLGEPGNTETEYCGSKTTSFDIVGKSLGDSDIVMDDIADYTYTSAAIMPEPKVVWKGHGADGADVELVAGEDFKYTYTSNVNAGTGTVRIEPVSQAGNFSGTKEKTFTILKKNLQDEGVMIDGIPDQVYIGDAITPKLNIHWEADGVGQVTLSDADYTLSYGEEGNVEVGTVEVTVNGTGNYEGTITTAFRIVKVKLSDITAEYSKEEQYTGKQIKPDIKLTYQSTDNRTIEMNAPDVWGYTISYGSNQLLGTTSGSITVTADPNGNCEGGPLVLHFAIIKRHLDDSTITMTGIEDTYTFDPNETACEPEPVLTFKPDPLTTYTLRKGYDYTVSYEGNTTVNQAASVTVTGIGNFDRSLTKNFRITKDLLDYIDSASVDQTPLVYNGHEQHPKVDIAFKTNDIEENRDYELVWDEDCINAGEHTVIIRGIGDYGGEMPLTFSIGKRDISKVQIDIEDYEFTGSEIDPMVVVSDPEISETPFGGDVYVITGIENNKEIGTATVTIEAVETSNYIGTTSGTFEITPVDLQSTRITSSQIDSPQDYTGSPVMPEITVTDTKRNAKGDAISEEDGESYYVLIEGTDYEVEYSDNIYPGETPATVIVTGKGCYTGTLSKMFDIQADLALAVIAPIPAQPYTGEEVRPELTVTLGDRTLRENFDYRVEYTDNIERGTALATIYPIEGSLYSGSNQASFVISRDIAGADISISHSEYVYTGGAIRPEVIVVFEGKNLVLGTDFEVTYENNVNVGTATITVTGIGGYDGNVTLTFEIVSRDITDARIEMIDSEFTYTGSEITPAVAVVLGDVILTPGVDYEIRYENNINVGTASVIVTGIGGNEGTVRRAYEIIKRNITRCAFANITDKIYLGMPTSQDLVVTDGSATTLVLNRDYTLTYENNAAPGVATLVVSGIGNYGGTKTIRYLINFTEMTPVTAAASSDSVTVAWGAVPGAEGYGIYSPDGKLIARTEGLSYVHTNLDALTSYSYMVRPYKTSGGTAYYGGFSNTAQATTGILTPAVTLKAGKRRVKVSWKKIKGVNGYEIYRSSKKTKGYKKIKTASKASIVAYTNKKLDSKKKYYYKVRAYKKVNGKKVYSSYSSVKSVKVK